MQCRSLDEAIRAHWPRCSRSPGAGCGGRRELAARAVSRLIGSPGWSSTQFAAPVWTRRSERRRAEVGPCSGACTIVRAQTAPGRPGSAGGRGGADNRVTHNWRRLAYGVSGPTSRALALRRGAVRSGRDSCALLQDASRSSSHTQIEQLRVERVHSEAGVEAKECVREASPPMGAAGTCRGPWPDRGPTKTGIGRLWTKQRGAGG